MLPFPSISTLASLIREGRVTAVELTEQALTAAKLGAYCEIERELSLKWAAAADAAFRAGLDRGLLQGLPISIKDLYGVPGFRTRAGTTKPLPTQFEQPGPLVNAILSRLGVITGKTHTVEFAFGGVGTNPHYSMPINPWDSETIRASGGSTAGGGVSLCEGSAVLALGTDTAGSVRIPASWTGNVALKTTKGRWSTEGIVPLSPTLDTPGFLARTIEDLCLVFEDLDREVCCVRSIPSEIPQLHVHQLRLGRCDELLFEDCSPGVVEAIETALNELVGAGASLVSLEIPELLPTYEIFGRGGPVSAELSHFLASHLPEWLEGLDPNVRARLGNAATMTFHEYRSRLDELQRFALSVSARLSDVDAVVCPTVANSPPPLDAVSSPESYGPQNLLCLRNTSLVSYLGLCAVTLPVGSDAEAMPVGLQLIGRPHDEPRLLAIAKACERLLGTSRERLGVPPRLRKSDSLENSSVR